MENRDGSLGGIFWSTKPELDKNFAERFNELYKDTYFNIYETKTIYINDIKYITYLGDTRKLPIDYDMGGLGAYWDQYAMRGIIKVAPEDGNAILGKSVDLVFRTRLTCDHSYFMLGNGLEDPLEHKTGKVFKEASERALGPWVSKEEIRIKDIGVFDRDVDSSHLDGMLYDELRNLEILEDPPRVGDLKGIITDGFAVDCFNEKSELKSIISYTKLKTFGSIKPTDRIWQTPDNDMALLGIDRNMLLEAATAMVEIYSLILISYGCYCLVTTIISSIESRLGGEEIRLEKIGRVDDLIAETSVMLEKLDECYYRAKVGYYEAEIYGLKGYTLYLYENLSILGSVSIF